MRSDAQIPHSFHSPEHLKGSLRKAQQQDDLRPPYFYRSVPLHTRFQRPPIEDAPSPVKQSCLLKIKYASVQTRTLPN